MRRTLTFAIDGVPAHATLDAAPGTTGLLIVSGGNEVRAGAHRGMALLADAVARAGFPVFRFDRRGVGDSEGDNRGFEHSAPDIDAALSAFRAAAPQVVRVVAFGNCDAATALLLHAPAVDALVLANPWVIEEPADAGEGAPTPESLPAAAIRARYLSRLRDPASILRLIRGQVDFGKLWRGLRAMRYRAAPASDGLAARVLARMARVERPTTILLATGDRTAQAFIAAWDSATGDAARAHRAVTIERRATASHTLGGPDDAAWLLDRLLDRLRAG